MPKNLIEQVLKTVRNYDMLKAGDSVLAAVSGGPDSVFLLVSLAKLKDKLRLKDISVCNLDHGLRGRESQKDSLFVKTLAEDLGIKFIRKNLHLKKIVKRPLSTEELARQARYKFFKSAAKRLGASVIATGHTLDDQAETVLMRIIKGASLKGGAGIPPVREEEGVRIIRPLIELEKREIKEYLDRHSIDYRTDSTNLEPIYFRNVVRNEIIPFLERYNLRLKRALSNFAEHLREDAEFIRREKSRVSEAISHMRGARLEIYLKDIVVQPQALRKEIMRDALEKTGGEVKKLTFRHWREVENFINHKRRGNSIDLPGGIRITRTSGSLLFYRI